MSGGGLRIIDAHTHLAGANVLSRDPLPRAARTARALLEPHVSARGRALLDMAGALLAPAHEALRARALGIVDDLLARSRNRAVHLGEWGAALAHGSRGLVEAGFLRGSPATLLASLDAAGIDGAVVLPVPPHASTEEILDLVTASPRLVPFCCPVPGEPEVESRIEAWKARGCRGIKVHATIHGTPPDDPFYLRVCDAARALSLPVVLHTGCLDVGCDPSHAIYSRPRAMEPLLREFPGVRFILAHMGLFTPEEAIELASRRENALLDTSWQPATVIARAVSRVGAERVLFASDWPFLGTAHGVLLDVVAAGVGRGPAALERVLSRNAIELLGLPR